ncbi:MAG: cytochrome b/b6 domain-containing protein [Burkholderiaceae bacterium]
MTTPTDDGMLYYRHRLPVRLMHWINVVCLAILLMSGLGIFNAHPTLYWGESSYNGRPVVMQVFARPSLETGRPRGILKVFGREYDTTGVLGVSKLPDGTLVERAFPHWITLPGYYSLADARAWHFFFAWLFVINGFCYLLYTIFSGHLSDDMVPTSPEVRNIGASINDHLRFRHPAGEAAKRYNVLQQFAYLIVIFLLLPGIALMGMGMSPMLDTLITGWVGWFGGRQSVRTLHFAAACLIVGFVLVHVFEVLVSGVWNQMRSMVTGYYRVPTPRERGPRR